MILHERCRDRNRQYENNNNCELDNGVYNKHVLDESPDKSIRLEEDEPQEEPQFEELAQMLDANIETTDVSGEEETIHEEVVARMERYEGFPQGYTLGSLKRNELNHATTTYYLFTMD